MPKNAPLLDYWSGHARLILSTAEKSTVAPEDVTEAMLSAAIALHAEEVGPAELARILYVVAVRLRAGVDIAEEAMAKVQTAKH